MKIGGVSPENWYKERISFEKPILHGYIDGIERQIQDSKKDYASRAKVVEEIEMPEIGLYQEVEVVDGIDNVTYSFEAVFEEYFPQLQRQSCLITLYSFFESEVRGLCAMFDGTFDIRNVGGKGSYLAKCLSFLENNCKAKIDRADPNWLLIDNGVRIVRNCIVHNQAALPENTSDDYKQITDHLNEVNQKDVLLEENAGRVDLKEGYVNLVLEAFDAWLSKVASGLPA